MDELSLHSPTIIRQAKRKELWERREHEGNHRSQARSAWTDPEGRMGSMTAGLGHGGREKEARIESGGSEPSAEQKAKNGPSGSLGRTPALEVTLRAVSG